jgi:hypothetical protein
MIDRQIVETNCWEARQVSLLISYAKSFAKLRRNKVFLDIGAYFGLYALLMDREEIFDKIIAFEPDTSNYFASFEK